jgi:hypothetical protein
MHDIWEFLKKLYWDAYDLPSFYIGIKGDIPCHIFTSLFLILLLIIWIWIVKMKIGIYKMRKEGGSRKKRIDKLLLGVLEGNDKNKKTKNI